MLCTVVMDGYSGLPVVTGDYSGYRAFIGGYTWL